MPKMVSLRLDEELLEWADGFAKSRGVSRTEVVAEGLRSLRKRPVQAVIRPGTPSARASSRRGVISGAVIQRASSDIWERQAKLNKAKYG